MTRPVYVPFVTTDEWRFPLLATGQEVYPRQLVSSNAVTSATGRLRLVYFFGRKSETITQVRTISGGTAAAATPSLCRVGIYTVDTTTYAATLAGACASDTTLWASANNEYVVDLASSIEVVAGALYAWATLCVTAETAPMLTGQAGPTGMGTTAVRGVPSAGFLDAQDDLPATVALAALTGSANAPYGELVP